MSAVTQVVPLDTIVVEDRYRRDLGDIGPIAASIASVGLLHPPVVTPSLTLVAGQRRLEAVRSLGFTEVEVRVVTSVDSALTFLRAERDENTCRKDMTVSEKVAIGRAIEELERPAADERRREGNSVGGRGGRQVGSQPTTDLPKPRSPRTQDIVGPELGMGGVTYSRAKTVVTYAEGVDGLGNPVAPEVQEVAKSALAEMDATGKVNPAFNKVKEAARGANGAGMRPRSAKPPTPPRHEMLRGTRRIDPNRVIGQTVLAVDIPTTTFEFIDWSALDRDQLDPWIASLAMSIRVLGQLKNLLTKERDRV